MRISDWSSDVCSSDLPLIRRFAPPSPAGGRRAARFALLPTPARGTMCRRTMQQPCLPPTRTPMPDTAPDQPASPAPEVTGQGKRVPVPSGRLPILADIGLRTAAGVSVHLVGRTEDGRGGREVGKCNTWLAQEHKKK